MGAIRERDLRASEQLHVRFVDERSRLQRVTRSLPAQMPAREPMERAVHNFHQLLPGDGISGLVLPEKFGDLRVVWRDASIVHENHVR